MLTPAVRSSSPAGIAPCRSLTRSVKAAAPKAPSGARHARTPAVPVSRSTGSVPTAGRNGRRFIAPAGWNSVGERRSRGMTASGTQNRHRPHQAGARGLSRRLGMVSSTMCRSSPSRLATIGNHRARRLSPAPPQRFAPRHPKKSGRCPLRCARFSQNSARAAQTRPRASDR